MTPDTNMEDLRAFALAKMAKVLGRERAHQLLGEQLAALGIDLRTPAQLLTLGEAMTTLGGFEGAVGAMLTVAAVLRGAKRE